MSNYRLRKDNRRLRKKLKAARIRHRRQLRAEVGIIRYNCDQTIAKWAHAYAAQEYDAMERGERLPVRWDGSAYPIIRKMEALGGSIEELAFSTIIGPELMTAGNDYIRQKVRDQIAWELARFIYDKEIVTTTSRDMPYGTCYASRLLVVRLTSPDGQPIDNEWRKDTRRKLPLDTPPAALYTQPQ